MGKVRELVDFNSSVIELSQRKFCTAFECLGCIQSALTNTIGIRN